MMKRNQFRHGATADAQPLWRRVLGLFCVLLVAVASSAQAVHTHGQTLPSSHHEVKAPAQAAPGGLSDVNCLLCMAMHSALPAAPAVAVVPAQLSAVPVVVTAKDRVPETSWHYAMFSRPPPAVETL